MIHKVVQHQPLLPVNQMSIHPAPPSHHLHIPGGVQHMNFTNQQPQINLQTQQQTKQIQQVPSQSTVQNQQPQNNNQQNYHHYSSSR